MFNKGTSIYIDATTMNSGEYTFDDLTELKSFLNDVDIDSHNLYDPGDYIHELCVTKVYLVDRNITLKELFKTNDKKSK